MNEKEALQEIKKYKLSGNCYLENYRGGGRVFIAIPGDRDDKEAQAYCKSSSRWSYLGEFVKGKRKRTRRRSWEICETMKIKYPCIKEIDYGGGYDSPSGYAYDVMLAAGYYLDDPGHHWFSEWTLKDLESSLANVRFGCQCDDDCKNAKQSQE